MVDLNGLSVQICIHITLTQVVRFTPKVKLLAFTLKVV